MNRGKVLRELFVLELKRARLPALRSLIPPLLLGASALLRSEPRQDLLVASLGVGLALAAIAVGLQVGRDREDGTLQYFASMPIQGEILAGARFLAVMVCCAFVACVALLSATLAMTTTSTVLLIRGLIGVALLCLVLGWVVIGLLSRYSWTAIVTWPVLVMVAGGFLIDLTGIGRIVSAKVAPLFTSGALSTSLLALAILLWAIVILSALGAFALAMSGLQPNGGLPTAEAMEKLASYHRAASKA